MSAAAVTGTGQYVYGVTWADAAPPAGGVHLLEHGELAAIVASVPPGEVRARRADLLRHAEVLQQAFVRGTVVPLRFGTVFESEEQVVAGLVEPRYEQLVALLQRLDGLAELTVRALYEEQPVLAEIAVADPLVRALRGATGHAERIRLGEAVAHALEAWRERDAGEIVASLAPLSEDVVVEERVLELEVVRAAFLVARDAVDAFEARTEELARGRAGVVRMKLTGPLPPHHFVGGEWVS